MPALARAHPRGSGRSDARLGGEGNADRMEHPPGTPRPATWNDAEAGFLARGLVLRSPFPGRHAPGKHAQWVLGGSGPLTVAGAATVPVPDGYAAPCSLLHPAAHSIGWNQGPSVIGFCFGDCQPGTGSSGQPGPGGGGRDAVREARPGTGSRGAVRPVQRPVRGRFGAGSAPALSACSITLRMTLGRASSPRVSSATQRPASRPTVPASSRQAAQTSSSR